MECPYCAATNRDGTRYCSSCGKRIDASASVSVESAVKTASAQNSTPAALLASTPSALTNTSGMPRSLVAGARLQGGRYQVKKVLGEGGMGAALLAIDQRLDDKPVVIKELISASSDPTQQQEDVRNFKREVSLLAHLDHPLIPNVTDHFQEGQRYFMVQEYVEGENLEERLQGTGQPLKEREALICASEILDVLDYLAQQTPPVVHRDIKPANIVIGTRDKRAHLVDFGIARADAVRNVKRRQTAALGTPGYAPPEQYQGNADPRSDLYALGATLHHLLTNRDPRNHAPFQYPPVRTLNAQLSPDVEQVLARVLVNNPDQRYQSAAAMKQDIDRILRQRFGLTGNLDSYTLGTSSMNAVQGQGATSQDSTAQTNAGRSGVTPVQLPAQPVPISTPPAYPSPSPQFKARRRSGVAILLILLLVLVLGSGVFLASLYLRPSTHTATAPTATSTVAGIGVKQVGNEPIGLSDGSYVLDPAREDGDLKKQAAQALQKNSADLNPAIAYLNQAVGKDSSDPEAHIYLENLRVLSSGSPYVTVAVATMLSGTPALTGLGRDTLQGAFVAQKEFNDGAKLQNGMKVRMVIANSGGKLDYVQGIAQQLVELAKKDKTFVGVMGWPYSDRTQQAITTLAAAHIPLLSQTASSDALSGISPYFFRVAPSNNAQGIEGAKYAESQLKASKVALFYDPRNPYSQSLAQDFQRQFQDVDHQQVVAEETYTVGQASIIPDKLQDALKHSPNLIYFAGYAEDISTLLSNLPANSTPSDLPVMGGDALYSLSGYQSSARAGGFSHLRFTTFAYPDEWDILGYTAQKPKFFSEYPAAFDPYNLHQGSPYGFTREDNDVILSYDALLALLSGCDRALRSGKSTPTPEDVQQGLRAIRGDNALQGVSGRISFDENGDVENKALVVVSVDTDNHIHMETVLGQFLKA